MQAAWGFGAGRSLASSPEECAFSRTASVLGEGAIDALSEKTVAVFGLGGVGSFAAEALARAGLGRLILVDSDVVCMSNLNRQLYALHSTLGKKKAEVAAAPVKDINPLIKVEGLSLFYPADATASLPVNLFECSFVADCIDSIPSKVALIAAAKEAGAPIVSCMGTGGKTDPLQFRFADIYSTSVCPLARAMRKELRQRNIDSLRVLFSTELPVKQKPGEAIGSVPFVPSVAGLLIAGEIVMELVGS